MCLIACYLHMVIWTCNRVHEIEHLSSNREVQLICNICGASKHDVTCTLNSLGSSKDHLRSHLVFIFGCS